MLRIIAKSKLFSCDIKLPAESAEQFLQDLHDNWNKHQFHLRNYVYNSDWTTYADKFQHEDQLKIEIEPA